MTLTVDSGIRQKMFTWHMHRYRQKPRSGRGAHVTCTTE